VFLKFQTLFLHQSFGFLRGHFPGLPDERGHPGVVQRRHQIYQFVTVDTPGVEGSRQLIEYLNPGIGGKIEMARFHLSSFPDFLKALPAEAAILGEVDERKKNRL